MAIDSVMARCLEELIQAPGLPSLYWALADRPRPFIDLTPGLAGERSIIEWDLPDLRELDQGVWGVDKARRFVDDVQRQAPDASLVDRDRSSCPGRRVGLPGTPTLRDFHSRLRMVAMIVKAYPEARRSLIADGRPAARIEAMPAVQVVSLFTPQKYHRAFDDSSSGSATPYCSMRPAHRELVPRAVAIGVQSDLRRLLAVLPRHPPSRRQGPGSIASSTPSSASRRSAWMPPRTGRAAGELGGDHRGAGPDRSGDRQVVRLQGQRRLATLSAPCPSAAGPSGRTRSATC